MVEIETEIEIEIEIERLSGTSGRICVNRLIIDDESGVKGNCRS